MNDSVAIRAPEDGLAIFLTSRDSAAFDLKVKSAIQNWSLNANSVQLRIRSQVEAPCLSQEIEIASSISLLHAAGVQSSPAAWRQKRLL